MPIHVFNIVLRVWSFGILAVRKLGDRLMQKSKKEQPILEEAEDQEASQSGPVGTEDLADVSEERAGIISIVKGLEEQVETAFELKALLEVELDGVRKKLAEESDARAELEAHVESLEASAALVEQLREDISFADEDRNKLHKRLSQVEPQLKEVTAERDSLAGKMDSAEARARELEGEKFALEAHVLNLKDKIADADSLRKELVEATEAHRHSREEVHNLTRSLEAAQASKEAIEGKLTATQQQMQTLREQVEEVREKLATAETQLGDLRVELEDQQVANRELVESKERLENEIQMANNKYEVTKGELDAFRDALRDIRSEATRTSGRVRQKYFGK